MQTQRLNLNNNIAILYKSITSEILSKDPCIKEIAELINQPKFYINFNYALYSDHAMVEENIFIPIFHTYSLSSGPKIVIIRSESMRSIIPVYPYHKYLVYGNTEEDKKLYDKLKSEFDEYNIEHITSLKELINEL